MNKFHFTAPLLFIFVIILLAPNLLCSQGQLTVIVTDFDRQPFPGVTVELCSPALKRIRSDITDADGTCIFPDLPSGSYQIMCELASIKSILRKNVRIFTKAEVLKLSMEKTHGEMVFMAPGPPPPVDPSITSFTSKDAIILNEASISLHANVASAWERMAASTDVCDKRAILKEALRNWKVILKEVKNKLTAYPQASKKRFMIYVIFDGMEQQISCDLDSISEFDQNILNLRAELSAIANFLKRVSDTGKATYDLHISSFPENAEMTYRYEEDGPLKEHYERTPTTIKDLYFAPIAIIFKQEVRTSVAGITYDPYKFLEADIHQVRMHLLDESQWGASFKNPPSLEERVNQSDLIIVGKVQKSECRRNKGSSDVYTYVTVSVEECIKGSDILNGNEIVLQKLGGSIKEEGIVHHVERHPAGFSQPGFSKNERVLLLLRLLPDSKHYEVVAGEHGKFSILKNDIIAERYVPLKEFIRKIKE